MRSYQGLKDLLREPLRCCRDRELRVKVELFLLAHRLGNVDEACRRRGFSRQFYYKWWGRFKRSKYALWSLRERSRRPHRSPAQVSSSIEGRIRALHRKGAGARMIEGYCQREGLRVSRSTIAHVLNGRKKVRRKRAEILKAHRRRYELDIPGQRLQLDVKYVPEFVGGERVYNFVAVDECTRWRFSRGYTSLDGGTTAKFLDALKAACPFPIHCIQTDNGFEFTYRLIPQVESKRMPVHGMDQWCREQRIRHRCIPPGEKELNGKVERSHRIDEQYFYWRAPTTTLARFNEALARWMKEYNSERPHGGIHFLTPNEKLQARADELAQLCFMDPTLESMRLNFLAELPKRRASKEDRQIQKLLADCEKYRFAA